MTVKCGGESEIDIELKKDGSLALSSLKALYEIMQQDCVSPQKMVEDEVSEL